MGRKEPQCVSKHQRTAHRHAYPRLWLDDDGLLVLLRYQHTGGEGRLDHVDHQVVGQDVQLLHLVARHVGAAGDAVTEQTRKTEESESTILPKLTAHWVWERFLLFFKKKNQGTLERIWLPWRKKKIPRLRNSDNKTQPRMRKLSRLVTPALVDVCWVY